MRAAFKAFKKNENGLQIIQKGTSFYSMQAEENRNLIFHVLREKNGRQVFQCGKI